MGLLHTSMVNGIAVGADLSNSSFERAEFTFCDFSLTSTRVRRGSIGLAFVAFSMLAAAATGATISTLISAAG